MMLGWAVAVAGMIVFAVLVLALWQQIALQISHALGA